VAKKRARKSENIAQKVAKKRANSCKKVSKKSLQKKSPKKGTLRTLFLLKVF